MRSRRVPRGKGLHDHNYILGSGSEGKVQLAAFLEVLLIVANIGVAVVMFPILKRQSERMALGYVASRIVEASASWPSLRS